MRTIAAVFGGIGAVVSASVGVASAGMWLFVGALMGDLANSVSLLLIGTAVVTAIFGVLGLVGAGLVWAGARLGAGAALMLIGAMGVAASTAAYPLLLPVIMAPVVEATGTSVTYPGTAYYAISLVPAVALLLGAALAFSARRSSGSRYGSSQSPA